MSKQNERLLTIDDYHRLSAADLAGVLAFWWGAPIKMASAIRSDAAGAEGALQAQLSHCVDLMALAAEARGLNSAAIRAAHAVYMRHLRNVASRMTARDGGKFYGNADDFLKMADWGGRDDAITDAERERLAAGVAEVSRLSDRLSADAAGKDGGADNAVRLHADERAILICLADAGAAMTQANIADAVRRGEKSVGKRLQRLREIGLTDRPAGERGGDAITTKGLQAISAAD